MERYKASEFGRRKLDAEDHWEKLDINSFRIDKPAIICLGGNGAKEARLANGVCKVAERLIGLKTKSIEESSTYDSVDILGFAYGSEMKDSVSGNLTENERTSIINNLLLPLCLSDKGKPLSVRKCCKNLAQISFFTWCYGAKEADAIMTKFALILTNLGYDVNDTKEMFRQMFHLSYAPMSDNNRLPMVKIYSAKDNIVSKANEYISNFGKFDGVQLQFDKAGTTMGKFNRFSYADSIGIYSVKLLNHSEKDYKEHSLPLISRDENWQLSKEDYISQLAELEKTPTNAECVSQMAGYALARAVANGIDNNNSRDFIPKLPMKQLCKELESIKDAYSRHEMNIKK